MMGRLMKMQRKRVKTGLLIFGAALILMGLAACGGQPTPASVISANTGSTAGDNGGEPTSDGSAGSATGTDAADANPTTATLPMTVKSETNTGAATVNQVDVDDVDVVEVTGVGSAVGIPDIAVLSLGVSVTADTVSEARNTAAATAQKVVDALMENTVAAEDISTVRFTIRPDYDYSQNETRFKGYTVVNSLRVTVREISAVGDVIDASIAAGGDNIVFNNLDFAFSETGALETEARENAVQDMSEKAAQLARFAGRELGELKKITENVGGGRQFGADDYRTFALEAAASFDTPISAGQDAITVLVYGVYELR
jgi:uncharacterized protein YggE